MGRIYTQPFKGGKEYSKKTKTKSFKCPSCGENFKLPILSEDETCVTYGYPHKYFCPHCGSELDKSLNPAGHIFWKEK